MSSFARIFGFLAVLALLLPNVAAQDKDKKDPDKKGDVKKDDLKKDEAKKDDAKKDDAKDKKPSDDKGSKKDPKKSVPEEKPVHGQIIKVKLKRIEANSARDFAVEWPVVDPQKVLSLNQWKVQTLAAISQDGNPVNRANRMTQFQADMARKQATEIYSMKDVEMRAPEGCKFRSLYPPVEYDDKGKLKKWTKKELADLRGNTKLPGYQVEFDVLRAGQTVEIYLTKTSSSLTTPKGKKKLDDDDLIMTRPEAVMIVVIQEAPMPAAGAYVGRLSRAVLSERPP